MRNYDGYQLMNEAINLNESKRKTIMSFLGITIPIGTAVGFLAWPIYRAIRASFDEKTRRCGIFRPNTTSRQICMLNVKIETLKKLKSISKDLKVLKQIEKQLNKSQIILSKENAALAKKGKMGIKPAKKDETKWF